MSGRGGLRRFTRQGVLEAGQRALEAGQRPLEAGRGTLEAGQRPLEGGQHPLEAGQGTLEAGQRTLEAGRRPLETGQGVLETWQGALEGGQGVLEALPSTAARAADGDRAERCEMCGVGLGGPHGHVVALDDRSLRCACRPCHLLFEAPGAGGGRFRAVPERYLTDPEHRLSDEDWELLRIPVTTVFFFVNSDLDRVIACYPSPAGATECLLDLAEWGRLGRSYPLLLAPVADVEAVYVTRSGDGLETFLIPVDACYALVGQVRLRWRGIDGGDGVREAMAGFLADLLARARPLR